LACQEAWIISKKAGIDVWVAGSGQAFLSLQLFVTVPQGITQDITSGIP